MDGRLAGLPQTLDAGGDDLSLPRAKGDRCRAPNRISSPQSALEVEERENRGDRELLELTAKAYPLWTSGRELTTDVLGVDLIPRRP